MNTKLIRAFLTLVIALLPSLVMAQVNGNTIIKKTIPGDALKDGAIVLDSANVAGTLPCNKTPAQTGDVTKPANNCTTTVETVGGATASAVAAGAALANSATQNATPGTLVKRDGSGGFSGSLNGNATTATTAATATTATNADYATTAGTAATSGSFSGSLSGDVTGAQGSTVVTKINGAVPAAIATSGSASDLTAGTVPAARSGAETGDVTKPAGSAATTVVTVGGATAANVAAATAATSAATDANTAGAIVRRDGAGNFAVGTITGALNGNAATATTAGSAANFSGNLSGDVTGNQGATVVTKINGATPAAIATSGSAADLTAGTIPTARQGAETGDVTRPSGSAVTTVVEVGGLSAADVADGAQQAIDATSVATPGRIVKRNNLGQFAGALVGNADTATLATNATNANHANTATTAITSGSFSGNLAGDVTGAQGSTVVTKINGATPAAIATSGSASDLTAGTLPTGRLPALTGDVTSSAGSATTAVATVGGATASNVAAGAALANAATNANTPSTVVRRDASGNFSAGTITANIAGNASTATSATTAGSATNFSGTLTGDVSGAQGATVVGAVGGATAANIATATSLVNAATDDNLADAIVKRDSEGSAKFSATHLKEEGSAADYDASATVAGGGTLPNRGAYSLLAGIRLFKTWDGAVQFAIGQNAGAVEFWQAEGGITNTGAVFFATNPSATGSVNGVFVAQESGGFLFGNGSGPIFALEDAGDVARSYLRIKPGTFTEDPTLYSTEDLRIDAAEGSRIALGVDGNSIADFQQNGIGTPPTAKMLFSNTVGDNRIMKMTCMGASVNDCYIQAAGTSGLIILANSAGTLATFSASDSFNALDSWRFRASNGTLRLGSAGGSTPIQLDSPLRAEVAGNRISASGTGSTFAASPASAGSLDNVAIGASTPAAGTFTTASFDLPVAATFSALPSAASNSGRRYYVASTGCDFRSNGTNWLPQNGGCIIAQSTVPASTAASTLTQTLATIPIEGNLLGLTGCIEVDTTWNWPGTTNAKTWAVLYGSTPFTSLQTTTGTHLGARTLTRFCNEGSNVAQGGIGANSSFSGISTLGTTAKASGTEISTGTLNLTITLNMAAGLTETGTLLNYKVTLVRK